MKGIYAKVGNPVRYELFVMPGIVVMENAGDKIRYYHDKQEIEEMINRIEELKQFQGKFGYAVSVMEKEIDDSCGAIARIAEISKEVSEGRCSVWHDFIRRQFKEQ